MQKVLHPINISDCIVYGDLGGELIARINGTVTLLQSSRKLGTSLSVGWKLAMSECASSSGSNGPSASSRESESIMETIATLVVVI